MLKTPSRPECHPSPLFCDCALRRTDCPSGALQKVGIAPAYLAAVSLVAFVLPARLLADEIPPPKPPEFHVTEAKGVKSKTNVVQLGETLEGTVNDLDRYIAANGGKLENILLYLDSRPLPGLEARRVAGEKSKLRFDLKSIRDPDAAKSNQPVWNRLLGSPTLGFGEKRAYSVTVGLAGAPLDSKAEIRLVVVPEMWGGIGLCIVATITIGLVAISWCSDVLRDGENTSPGDRKPFSLSRVQLAIWFWAIICSYIFIWVINGETASLTGQVLGILGISNATLIGAVVMDQRPTRSAARTPTKWFLEDILSDGDGISLYRFQVAAWTVVLVVIFLSTVWQTVSMPVFDGYLLALMGMSSGTYVSLKK